MVPENISSDVITEDDKHITKTYLLDFENKSIHGYTEGKPAIEQAIRKILDTKGMLLKYMTGIMALK